MHRNAAVLSNHNNETCRHFRKRLSPFHVPLLRPRPCRSHFVYVFALANICITTAGQLFDYLVAFPSANDSEYIPVNPLVGFVGETSFKPKHVKEYLLMVEILEACGKYIPEIRGSWSLGRPSICTLYRMWLPSLYNHFRASRFPLHHTGRLTPLMSWVYLGF